MVQNSIVTAIEFAGTFFEKNPLKVDDGVQGDDCA